MTCVHKYMELLVSFELTTKLTPSTNYVSECLPLPGKLRGILQGCCVLGTSRLSKISM